MIGLSRIRRSLSSPTPLTDLGVPAIWRSDVQRGWRLMQFVFFPVTRLLAPRSPVYGLERLPLTGPAVLAANHFAAVDGFVIGSFSSRPIWFMVKSEIADRRFIGEALGWTGGFPVRRGTCSHETIRNACDLVHSGHMIGVLPEGTRQRQPMVKEELEAGAALIALHGRAPIIPCAIDSFRWSLRNRRACPVVFGEPLDLTGLDAREATAQLREELARLLGLAQEATRRSFPTTLSDGTRRHKGPAIKQIVRVPAAPRVSGHPRAAPNREAPGTVIPWRLVPSSSAAPAGSATTDHEELISAPAPAPPVAS